MSVDTESYSITRTEKLGTESFIVRNARLEFYDVFHAQGIGPHGTKTVSPMFPQPKSLSGLGVLLWKLGSDRVNS